MSNRELELTTISHGSRGGEIEVMKYSPFLDLNHRDIKRAGDE